MALHFKNEAEYEAWARTTRRATAEPITTPSRVTLGARPARPPVDWRRCARVAGRVLGWAVTLVLAVLGLALRLATLALAVATAVVRVVFAVLLCVDVVSAARLRRGR